MRGVGKAAIFGAAFGITFVAGGATAVGLISVALQRQTKYLRKKREDRDDIRRKFDDLVRGLD